MQEMNAAEPASRRRLAVDLARELTLGIKHTSAFARRRVLLLSLLDSIRKDHKHAAIRIMVADDGDGDREASAHRDALRKQGIDVILLGAGSGLSYGRNELVRAARTPFVALMDDDLEFHESTNLTMMVAALHADPSSMLAGGCYVDARSGESNCYNMRFESEDGGRSVQLLPVQAASSQGSSCYRVGVTHNFFVARTAALRRFRWDARQKMMEHETFFYQLHLHEQGVLACPRVTVRHHSKQLITDKNYSRLSLRFKEQRFAQYLCKNYPELARLTTPFAQWHCRTHVFCTPAWWAQFAFDGSSCTAMHYAPADDASTVALPLVSPAIHPSSLFPARRASVGAASTRAQFHVPLLVLVASQKDRAAWRTRQRSTWLTYAWHQGHLSREHVPWRFVFAMPRPSVGPIARSAGALAGSSEDDALNRLMGDMVTLRAVEEGAPQASLIAEALRWALSGTASFDYVLVTDDHSLVHIGRLWAWLALLSSSKRADHESKQSPRADTSHLVAGQLSATGSHVVGPDVVLGRAASARVVSKFDALSRHGSLPRAWTARQEQLGACLATAKGCPGDTLSKNVGTLGREAGATPTPVRDAALQPTCSFTILMPGPPTTRSHPQASVS